MFGVEADDGPKCDEERKLESLICVFVCLCVILCSCFFKMLLCVCISYMLLCLVFTHRSLSCLRVLCCVFEYICLCQYLRFFAFYLILSLNQTTQNRENMICFVGFVEGGKSFGLSNVLCCFLVCDENKNFPSTDWTLFFFPIDWTA